MELKELHQLAKLSRDIANYFDDDMLTTASVIIYNVSFTVSLSDSFKESDVEKDLQMLNKMAKYRKDSHCLQWFNTELSNIIYGYFASLDYDDIYDLDKLQDLEDLKNESELNALESQSHE
jgi:hypothetical protein